MIKELFLSLSLPGWVFFVLILLLFLLTFVYYRRTIPPLSGRRKVLLTVVRAGVLGTVLFLLLQPVLQFVYEIRELPTVAVLLDNSSSMKIKDSFGVRADSVRFILKNAPFKENSDSLHFELFTFDGGLHRWQGDSLDFSGNQTNISHAISEVADSLARQNLQAIILISDGQFNQGVNPVKPAAASPVPVYSVAVGDSLPRKDLLISGLQVNRVAYVGKEVPVLVRIIQTGWEGGEVQVRLRQGKKQLAVKRVKLQRSGFEQQVSFALKADKAGEFRYTVEIIPREGEITTRNNRASFLLRVLKSKLRVLLLSGQPTFDQRMLVYVLRQLPDIQFTVLTEKSPGTFYEGDFRRVQPDSQDVFIFLGFPTERTLQKQLQQIFQSVQERKLPLFFLINSNTVLEKLLPWKELLPVEVPSRLIPRENVMAKLTAGGQLHPVTRLTENRQNLLSLWQDLPPVESFGQGLKFRPGNRVLLTEAGDESSSGSPLLVASVQKETKSLLLAAADFAGWHLQLQDDPNRDTFFQTFIERAVKWLANREDIQRVQIRPAKKVFSAGEAVTFSGQVLDEFYHPLDDAEVEIVIQGEGIKRSDVLMAQGSYYQYQASGLAPGTYSYRLTARRNGEEIGRAEGKIVVEELELEMQELQANPALMREIALRSGGRFWSARQLVKQLKTFRFKQQVHFSKVEHILWNKGYWLVLLVLLLSIEWFLRKRWGLL